MPDWILIIVGLLFFDTNGKIAKNIVGILPHGWRARASRIALKIEAKIDKMMGVK